MAERWPCFPALEEEVFINRTVSGNFSLERAALSYSVKRPDAATATVTSHIRRDLFSPGVCILKIANKKPGTAW